MYCKYVTDLQQLVEAKGTSQHHKKIGQHYTMLNDNTQLCEKATQLTKHCLIKNSWCAVTSPQSDDLFDRDLTSLPDWCCLKQHCRNASDSSCQGHHDDGRDRDGNEFSTRSEACFQLQSKELHTWVKGLIRKCNLSLLI